MKDEGFHVMPDVCPDCGWTEDDCDCNGPGDTNWRYEDGEWECLYPDKCLMADPIHHCSECYTVEDAREWANQERRNP